MKKILLTSVLLFLIPTAPALAGAIACYNQQTGEFCGFPPCSNECEPGLPDMGENRNQVLLHQYRTCGHSRNPQGELQKLVLNDLHRICTPRKYRILSSQTIQAARVWGYPGDGVECGTLYIADMHVEYICY